MRFFEDSSRMGGLVGGLECVSRVFCYVLKQTWLNCLMDF